jgi:hypothetical protein
MKIYLSVAAILTASLAIPKLATAHGGGSGIGGGAHIGGGGMHFSTPPAMVHFSAPAPAAHFASPAAATHFSAPPAAGQFAAQERNGAVPEQRDDRSRHHWDRNGYRGEFWGGNWPSYYGDSSYGGSDYSTPDYTGSDSAVVAVQKALAREGYYHGPIDGTLDLITQDAIAKYDRDRHLPVAHTINQALLSSLRIG